MTETEKSIQDLLIAVKVIEKTQETTTINLDKLTSIVQATIPFTEKFSNIEEKIEALENEANQGIRPVTLKNILAAVSVIVISFGTWTTLMIFALDKSLSNHQTMSSQVIEKFIEDIQDNKNQIIYLKGRLK